MFGHIRYLVVCPVWLSSRRRTVQQNSFPSNPFCFAPQSSFQRRADAPQALLHVRLRLPHQLQRPRPTPDSRSRRSIPWSRDSGVPPCLWVISPLKNVNPLGPCPQISRFFPGGLGARSRIEGRVSTPQDAGAEAELRVRGACSTRVPDGVGTLYGAC